MKDCAAFLISPKQVYFLPVVMVVHAITARASMWSPSLDYSVFQLTIVSMVFVILKCRSELVILLLKTLQRLLMLSAAAPNLFGTNRCSHENLMPDDVRRS